MAGIAADADPSQFRSTGRERKCGTCRNMFVKPPEVELAKYALPISACAPGVQCLGGAVRGRCQACDTIVESTWGVPNVPCKGRAYVAGGPSIYGTEGMDERTRAQVMGMAGSMNAGSRTAASGGTSTGAGGESGMLGIGLAVAGVLAGPILKGVVDWARGGSGSRAEGGIVRGKAGDKAWLETTDGLVPVQVTQVSPDGRKVWTRVTETVAERGRGERIATSWFHVSPAAAVFTMSNGQIRTVRYTWHPTAVWGPVGADKWQQTNGVALGRNKPPPWQEAQEASGVSRGSKAGDEKQALLQKVRRMSWERGTVARSAEPGVTAQLHALIDEATARGWEEEALSAEESGMCRALDEIRKERDRLARRGPRDAEDEP